MMNEFECIDACAFGMYQDSIEYQMPLSDVLEYIWQQAEDRIYKKELEKKMSAVMEGVIFK